MTDTISSTPDVRQQGISFALFLAWNVVFSLLAFPVLCLIVVLLFFNNEFGIATGVGIISVTHLIVLWIGLLLYRKVRVLAIPFFMTTAFVFLQNRHIELEFDTGPFITRDLSGGQQVWGLTSYYRVFDKPRDWGATTDFDWSAFFLGVEYDVLLTVLLGICVLGVMRFWR